MGGDQDNMATLIKRRGALKGQLTRFMNDVKEIKADSDTGISKIKRKKIEECWPSFQNIQVEIQTKDDAAEEQ